MDPLSNVPLYDLQVIIFIPLAIMTAIEVKKNWRKIWDNDLTVLDRLILQKINIFFIIPIVVLLHELGHAVAILWAGSSIQEFHYGVWWGYVVPEGRMSPFNELVVFVVGNFVQVVIGLLALVAAMFVTSPSVVALLVYLGLYSIGATLIAYTLMSIVGMYGDWRYIYSSPLTGCVHGIGAVHILLVIGLLYLIYGTAPKIWYSGKTRPKWFKDFKQARELVAKDPSAINYLNLAWSYYFVGLDKLCQQALDKVAKKNPDLLDRFMLSGWLRQNQGDIDGAIMSFEAVAERQDADPNLRSRALMAIGHCLMGQVEREQKRLRTPGLRTPGGNPLSPEAVNHVLAAYEQAKEIDPDIADPRFYKASVLNKVGLHKEAEKELRELSGLKWLDPALSELLTQEFRIAKKSDKQEQ